MTYKVGDTVKYKTLDMEYYQRGYGINYETGTSKIRAIQFRLQNGITVSESDILERSENEITYKTLDLESYQRGYGISYDTGSSTLQDILYVLENGYEITEKNILASDQ